MVCVDLRKRVCFIRLALGLGRLSPLKHEIWERRFALKKLCELTLPNEKPTNNILSPKFPL